MGSVVGQITGGLMGDPAQNNYSGNYDYAQGQIQQNAANQNALAKQVQQQAQSGQSPADILLRQATNRNIAQQGALIGSQRGINPGLAARNIAQTGAELNQQAAGQMAAQRAQEQINANQLQSNIYGNIGSEWAGNQRDAASGSLAQNQANAQAASGIIGGVASVLALAHGGEVQHFVDGGDVQPQSWYGKLLKGAGSGLSNQPYYNPSQNAPQNFSSPIPSQPMNIQSNMNGVGKLIGSGLAKGLHSLIQSGSAQEAMPVAVPVGNQMAGGPNDATSPINTKDSSQETEYAAKGGQINGETYAKLKKMVPGQAKVAGDNKKNDTVPAMLSPKEIILPRSVTMHPDAPEKAKKFVEAVLAKNRGKK